MTCRDVQGGALFVLEKPVADISSHDFSCKETGGLGSSSNSILHTCSLRNLH